jgi:peroxiredoxin
MPIFQLGQTFQLAYTKVDIHASGIALHGSLAVTDQQLVATLGIAFSGWLGAAGWPPAHVEFEQIPATGHQGILPPDAIFPRRPDYSALKSWIPGGADDQTAGQLEIFTRALRDNKRKDAVVAVLAVLTPEQLKRARHTQDVIYADSQDGAWERVFQVKTLRRPLTLIVGQKGGVAWQHEGVPDGATLAAAVGKHLMPGGSGKLEILQVNVRIGQPAPNFLFEFAPGRQLTLRKLAGRPAALVFWRSSSQPSIEAVRDLQQASAKAGAKGPAVLAVNDGEPTELAQRVALGNGLSATLVTDPKREISLAYGVSLWQKNDQPNVRKPCRGWWLALPEVTTQRLQTVQAPG